MRIISGTLKGREIFGYDINGTRPTISRVKESLFATIQEYVPNSICLDLFAGSGNLGIEAISNGASKCYFADHNKKAIETIKKNIDSLNISSKCEVMNMDYMKVLDCLEHIKFNLIFLDPPYDTDYIEKSIKVIENKGMILDRGLIICETDNKEKVKTKYAIVKEKKYGDKWVVIIQKI